LFSRPAQSSFCFPLKPPSKNQVQRYLASISISGDYSKGKKKIQIEYFGLLDKYGKDSAEGSAEKNKDIKQLGYGSPYLLVYQEIFPSGKSYRKKAILSTMRIGHGFGHDYRADRVDNTVLAFDSWNSLPQHCKVWDIGAFNKKDSSLLSLGEAGEFFLLRPMIEGVEYYKDLDRIFRTGSLDELDLEKAHSLAEYLAKVHRSKKFEGPGQRDLYARKIRDTVGHGECIFGLSDSYPSQSNDYMRQGELEEIEKKCVTQRWKLKDRSERLSRVHGDFHPWNILFQEKRGKPTSKFELLDRSRGEWGESADDVCALSINYLFYSLRKYGEVRNEFLDLLNSFMETYARSTGDNELSKAMPLFYVFRALVIASPVWYPDLSSEVRRKIFNFSQNILDEGSFDYRKVNNYFRGVN